MTPAALLEPLQKELGDRRLNVYELAVAQEALTGVADGSFAPLLERFASEHGLRLQVGFPKAAARWVAVGRAAVRATPRADATRVTEALFGEKVRAFDQQGDFWRVQLERDGYVGWLPVAALTDRAPQPTHEVRVLRAHAFAAPKVSAAIRLELSYGVRLAAAAEDEAWAKLELPDGQAGFVRWRVLEPLEAPVPEPTPEGVLAFATGFMHAPYLWGGRTAWGLDCSGFVQTVYAAHGIHLPRDADQQEACGRALEPQGAQPGDLFFLPGHVMIALDAGRFIHANAQHMRVTSDSFASDYGQSLEAQLSRAVRVL